MCIAGKLYVVGGFDGQHCLNSGEVYSSETDQWTFFSSMTTPRSGVAIISYQCHIYALGGFDGEARLQSGVCVTIIF